ncbi:MAG: regulatory protein RecX [Candidatus Kapabacteria bacterium]|nr:regulatory protein RecX [Candidatus Kapabacteria bacterium]
MKPIIYPEIGIEITEIHASKKKKGYVYFISTDGEYFGLYPYDAVLQHQITKQTIFTEEVINSFRKTVESMVIRSIALQFATYKPRTEKQVRDALNKKGFEHDSIQEAIAFLYSFGYLNDEEYAINFVKASLEKKPMSKKVLQYTLQTKGIPSTIISSVIEQYYPKENITELALKVVEKRFRKKSEYTKELIEKELQYLLRKGFSYSVVKDIRVTLLAKIS